MNLIKDHDFAVWAFGEELWNSYLVFDKSETDLMEGWNKLHGDLLTLEPLGGILEDMKKMKKLWKENETNT